jgi:Ca-activated chloride channel family protein
VRRSARAGISGEQGVFDYIRENLNQCNVFAFGIGTSVNRYLIEGVAKAGMGEPFIVTQEAEAPAQAAKFREYIQTPLLTNIQFRSVGFDTFDVHPAHLPDLFAARPVIVFGKWRGPAGGSIAMTGQTGRGPYQTSIAVVSDSASGRQSALRHLWARTRIANLADFGPGDPDDHVAQITSLGLTYGLLTKYTSFVAVQEIVRRTTGDAEDVDQPLPLPAGVSDRAIGMTSGAEPELVWISAIVLAIFAGVTLLSQRRRQSGGAA